MMRHLGAGLAGLAILAAAAPAAAQDDAEARLRRVEAEIRALQRKVFPDGAGKTLPPEIVPQAAPALATGAPSSSVVTDVLARLDALESQLQRLTAGNEENANALRLLQDRVKLLEGNGAAAPATVQPPADSIAPQPEPAKVAVTAPARPVPARPAPAKADGPTAARLAAVQAVEIPSTGNAADDAYSYGFRLWSAKLYPEAAQQLALYVSKYPNDPQISYGRNLLGRAYLDDGKPREAAPWFLKNYQEDKSGARAGDSLLYLGEAMIALKDTKRACIALAEFAETYPALASGRLKTAFDANRKAAGCK